MIEILQPEINVIPGDTPRSAPDRGWVGQGRTVIEITNDTNRNNAYRIHLECGNPRWKEYWYSFVALPPDNPQQVLQNQEDVYGPNNTWVHIYVPQKQTRRIILDVKAERLPEARAGVYPLTVVVQVSIASDRGGNWIEDATHRLDAVALMRPYHHWQFKVEPETARVGYFRKSRAYELVIENSGNDWLYCELEPPRLQKVMVDQPPTVRVAVPPPEDNRMPSVRTVPFKATTKERQFRGSVQDLPIPMVVRRVEAPSIPALPQTALQAPSSAQYRNAVVYRDPDQKDALKPPTDPILSYHPPIPATVEGCGKALVQNIKGLVLMALGLLLLFHLFDFMSARLIDQATISGVQLSAKNDQEKYEVEGKYVYKAEVMIVDADSNQDIGEPQNVTGAYDRSTGRQRYYISLKGVKNRRIRLEARRKVFLSYLAALIPRSGHKDQVILVGAPARKDYSLTVDPFQVGKDFTILTPGYASQVKLIRVGTQDLKPVRVEGQDKVVAHAPDNYPIPSNAPVSVEISVYGDDGEKPLAKATTSISKDAPPPTGMGADSGAAGGLDGGGAGSPAGGGAAEPPPQKSSPGASAATGALLKGNAQAAKAAAQQSPNDPEALALAAIACFQSGDDAGGSEMLQKAQAASADSSTSVRGKILVRTAEAVQKENGGNPDEAFLDAMESAKSSDPSCGVPFLLALQYYKTKGDRTMAKSIYGDALTLRLPSDQLAAIQKAGAGL